MDEDCLEEDNPSSFMVSRPSLAQVKALVEFMQRHPDLNHKKYRRGMSSDKFKKLWIELSSIANSIDGAVKSTKGWIKFWTDKKRCLQIKQRQIDQGKSSEKLSPLERKILNLSFESSASRKKKAMKKEPASEDNDSKDDALLSSDGLEFSHINKPVMTEMDERQMSIMEKVVDAMDQQASAMSQLAQATLNNAKALERLAEASHIQALAVDRMANTFETVTASVHDVRNAVMSIDYTMKRCYTATATHRQNSNLFS